DKPVAAMSIAALSLLSSLVLNMIRSPEMRADEDLEKAAARYTDFSLSCNDKRSPGRTGIMPGRKVRLERVMEIEPDILDTPSTT
ncbi:MAG TPA: hypothetical protein VFO82_17765, partial [Steroidobacteraceae bacterium]|nr:hypothetical protein [Steroidobacteraceae bacterium]